MGFRRTKGSVTAGSVAPDFTLPSQSGGTVRLGEFLGARPVVLFFYPKDNTLGCTREVCAFRDSFEELARLDAEIIGISSDSIDSHRDFAEKHKLPFILLSDQGGKVRRLYGVPNTFGIFAGRVTYIIDSNGIVRNVFSSQIAVEKHVEEALNTLKSIKT